MEPSEHGYGDGRGVLATGPTEPTMPCARWSLDVIGGVESHQEWDAQLDVAGEGLDGGERLAGVCCGQR